MNAETLARVMHETMTAMAPAFGIAVDASRTPWGRLENAKRSLKVAVARTAMLLMDETEDGEFDDVTAGILDGTRVRAAALEAELAATKRVLAATQENHAKMDKERLDTLERNRDLAQRLCDSGARIGELQAKLGMDAFEDGERQPRKTLQRYSWPMVACVLPGPLADSLRAKVPTTSHVVWQSFTTDGPERGPQVHIRLEGRIENTVGHGGE